MKKKIKTEPSLPYYTEGHWEDILDEIETLEKYQPSSNMGKWWISIQIEKLKKKLKTYSEKEKKA